MDDRVILVFANYIGYECDILLLKNNKCENLNLPSILTDVMRKSFSIKEQNPERSFSDIFMSTVRPLIEPLISKGVSITYHTGIPDMCALSLFLDRDNSLDSVCFCDFRIDKEHSPAFYKSSSRVYVGGMPISLVTHKFYEIADYITQNVVKLESFSDLVFYSVEDDRGIRYAEKSLGCLSYFKELARKHASDSTFTRHRVYVYEHKEDNVRKVYGCWKPYIGCDVENIGIDENALDIVSTSKDKPKRYSLVIDNMPFEDTITDIVYSNKVKITIKALFNLTEGNKYLLKDKTYNAGTYHEVKLNLNDTKGNTVLPLGVYSLVLKEKVIKVNKDIKDEPFQFELVFSSSASY